ncbi:hypothetical protein POVWA2_037540 [Plasmodium ovale wallikeri]|uniref:Uncharacterized protein n=1 Tax=Plasmodium ovale wallikeri TaxID=864142 RepID=A0A1A8Z665_PLAOA|nr:hypothetical protein POVWA1_038560 [Plasmodium ovale wallikeri]SBT39310.1 hypothetical protein POVWA2_037540 [Plasmodium ovale wallikeri]
MKKFPVLFKRRQREEGGARIQRRISKKATGEPAKGAQSEAAKGVAKGSSKGQAKEFHWYMCALEAAGEAAARSK